MAFGEEIGDLRGIAVFPDHGVTGEAILQLADATLCRANKTGAIVS